MQEGTSYSDDGKAVVAHGPILTVEACSCGVMHLHFGPVSMRFTEETLHEVHRTIGQALMRVAAPDTQTGNVAALLMTRGPARGEA